MVAVIIENKILTDREKEYLCFIALGYKNHITAEYLCVSFSTVKKTNENIFRKLRAKNRANAVTIAFVHNIINNKTFTSICKKYNLRKDFNILKYLV